MQSAYNPKNLQALKHAEAHSSIIENICQPLFNNFEITNFGYVRFYDNGTMLRLSTDHEWTKKYFMHEFYNDIDFYSMQDLKEGDLRKSLIYGTPLKEHHTALYDHNIWNIIVIYERQQNYGDVWFFGALRQHFQIMNFYINHMNVLEHFILYFRQKSHGIIDNKNNETLITTTINPFSDSGFENNDKNIFDTKKFYLEGKYGNIHFSEQEFECLKFLSRGKSIKEIATIIKISPKTVESYIHRIKNKTGGLSTSKIIDIFHKQYNFH